MYHSVIISGKNTFDEWGLVPKTRPLVNPPEVKETYMELPAADGMLDYTDLLMGRAPYGQRTGFWEFVVRPGKRWVEVYTSILNYLHGKSHRVILEDDPDFFYSGRLTVNRWKSDAKYSVIAIGYNLDPFRESVTASDDRDWLWNDLFNTTIRYGSFTVNGEKYRTLINRGLQPTTPVFYCSSPMTVAFNGATYSLVTGMNRNENLALQLGDNVMVFSGSGNVTVSYREMAL